MVDAEHAKFAIAAAYYVYVFYPYEGTVLHWNYICRGSDEYRIPYSTVFSVVSYSYNRL